MLHVEAEDRTSGLCYYHSLKVEKQQEPLVLPKPAPGDSLLF